MFLCKRWSKDLDSFNLNHLMLQVDAILFEHFNELISGVLNERKFTLQGYFKSFFYLWLGLIFWSRLISWLPAITILCLKSSFLRRSKKFSKWKSLPYLVKSPPWMKISPFCFSYTNFKRSSLLPWVSDVAIIISFLF